MNQPLALVIDDVIFTNKFRCKVQHECCFCKPSMLCIPSRETSLGKQLVDRTDAYASQHGASVGVVVRQLAHFLRHRGERRRRCTPADRQPCSLDFGGDLHHGVSRVHAEGQQDQ